MSGTISSPKRLNSPGTVCPGQWWDSHPWRDLGGVWMWPLGTWLSAGQVTPRLSDLESLFQTEQFCYSMDEFHTEQMNRSSGELITLFFLLPCGAACVFALAQGNTLWIFIIPPHDSPDSQAAHTPASTSPSSLHRNLCPWHLL